MHKPSQFIDDVVDRSCARATLVLANQQTIDSTNAPVLTRETHGRTRRPNARAKFDERVVVDDESERRRRRQRQLGARRENHELLDFDFLLALALGEQQMIVEQEQQLQKKTTTISNMSNGTL